MAQQTKQAYTSLDQLEHVSLEDGYVFGITEGNASLDFLLDAVLTAQNPLYTPPQGDDYACYRYVRLRYPNVARTSWDRRVVVPARDASGSVDYGNIDTFLVEDGSYRLSGDWGAVAVASDPPLLETLDTHDPPRR